ncbi:MAG: fructosamine kinase family protein, partial [Flavobacteriales bacterium]
MRPAKSDLENALFEFIGEPCELTPVSGGDSAFAFAMVTQKKKSFLKVYNGNSHSEIVESELSGLKALRESGVRTPKVIAHHFTNTFSYLNMEWVEEGGSVKNEDLVTQLVRLHKNSSSRFGFHHSNFVGSLSQNNEWDENWSSFWWAQRIEPLWNELRLSSDTYLIRCMTEIESNKERLFPIEAPALLHGDLWGGNVLAAKNQESYLIDPGVYFGHREMDLAMLTLFSDFRDVLELY